MRIRPGILLSTVALTALPLIGCRHELTIPASAMIVRSGEGRFGYIAEENGEVFVRDLSTSQLIVQAPVVRGELLYVEPTGNRIEMDGKVVDHALPMDPGHNYEIYFDRAQ